MADRVVSPELFSAGPILGSDCFCGIGDVAPGQVFCVTCVGLFAEDSPVRSWWDATVVPGCVRPLAARNPVLARELLLERARMLAGEQLARVDSVLGMCGYMFSRRPHMFEFDAAG